MLGKVIQFVKSHLPQSCRVVVGLSGGADSIALLIALRECGVDCIAAHCNFHLRGKESDRDSRHCVAVCEQLGVELVIRDFDVQARRDATSESVEMACRSLRYEWWSEMSVTFDAKYIAVGHHREDNVETFFLNLLRGCGIAGLKGMLPVNGNIIRPLLDVSRDEIENYVTSHGLSWVTDSTNLKNDYKRNRLRNIIIPIIEREFPGAMDAMARTIGHLRDNYEYYNSAITSRADRYRMENGSVDVKRLLDFEPQARLVLYEMLSAKGFTKSQISDISDCAEGLNAKASSGQIFITPSAKYILERGVLSKYCDAGRISVRTVDITAAPFSMTRLSYEEFRHMKELRKLTNESIYLDSSVLDNSPKWTLRSWQNGDRFTPLGMKGSRLVSDIFKDAKYPAEKKISTPLLFRNDELLWIVGIRASDLFKVRLSTTEIIKITMH